jgi:hypothetical protein
MIKHYELIKGIGFFILGGAVAKTVHIIKERTVKQHDEDEGSEES